MTYNRSFYFILFSILFCVESHFVSSATITSNGTGGGNWTSSTSWTGGIVPTTTDNVVILPGDILSVNLSRTVASISNSGIIDFPTTNRSLTCSGNFDATGTAKLTANAGSSTKSMIINGALNVQSGSNLEVQGISVTVNSTTSIYGTLLIAGTALGNKNFNASLGLYGSGAIVFDVAETLTITGSVSLFPGSVVGGGTAIGIVNISGNLNAQTGGTSTINNSTVTIGGNVTITGNGILQSTGTSTSFNVSGNWLNSSSATDSFVEGTSTVLFNGSSLQTITSSGGLETFYTLRIVNTSSSNPGVVTTSNLAVSNEMDFTSGTLDLSGKSLSVTTNSASPITCTFSNNSIVSSSTGSTIDFNDGAGDQMIVVFSTTTIGSPSQTIALTLNTGRSQYNGLSLYGIGNFTKSAITTDNSTGGNRFYNNVIFNQSTTSGDWIFGNGTTATGDIFYGDLTINANSSTTGNTFQLGRNSTGNLYYGTTIINSYSASSFYFGVSQTVGNNSHTFIGPTILNVGLSGNIYVGGAGTGNTSNISIQNTFQLNSISTSIGDIYIGARDLNGTVAISGSGQLTSGTISGATNIYLSNITQSNSTTSSLISSASSNSTLYVGYGLTNTATGSTAAFPCVFNGNTAFTMPNIGLRGSTFNGLNNFQCNGTAGSTSYGGNIFNGNTSFTSTNSGFWYLSNIQSDDFNANTTFTQSGSGLLRPVYTADCTFSGNITTNTAIITFGSNGGRLILDGSANQSITGSTSPIWRKARLLNTSGGITQNTPTITVVLDMDFQQGIISIPSGNMLIFNDNALATGMTNSSFADGQVRKIGNDAFTFPTGDATYYAPIAMSAPSVTTHHFTAQYFAANPNGASYPTSSKVSTLDFVSTCEYWILNRTNGTSNVSVTLSNASSRSCSATDIASYRVARWDGSMWQNHGNGGTTGSLAAGTVTSSSAITSFSPFTLASINAALPVELINFSAEIAESRNVLCTWETASEHNSASFMVERSSNGFDFEVIGSIAAAGNSTEILAYDFMDAHPLSGTSYYRLTQLDLDGKAHTYAPQAVSFMSNETIKLFPNPCTDFFTIECPESYLGQVKLEVYSTSGQLVLSEDWNLEFGRFKTLDSANLQTGTFYCRISSNHGVENVLLIKQ